MKYSTVRSGIISTSPGRYNQYYSVESKIGQISRIGVRALASPPIYDPRSNVARSLARSEAIDVRPLIITNNCIPLPPPRSLFLGASALPLFPRAFPPDAQLHLAD